MHNVALLKTNEGHTWIGNLSEIEHFQALVGWASEVSRRGHYVDFPEILESNLFIPDGDKS